MAPRKGRSGGAPHGYDGLDRALHERSRLSIMVALLSRPEGVAFTELKRLCGLTDGNLNRHLAVLDEARIVHCAKDLGGPRPTTVVRLTEGGRRQFLAYVEELDRVVRDARDAAVPASSETKGRRGAARPGWASA